MRALIACLVTLFAAWSASAQDWSDRDLGSAVREGYATADSIWLLGANGKVVRFARGSGEREVVAENVRDLLPAGDRLWVLTRAEDLATYVLRDLREDIPSTPTADRPDPRRRLYIHPSETSEGDVLGIFAWPDQDRPAILARRAVIVPVDEGWKRRTIAATLGSGGLIATPDGRSVYVGSDHGEWGGGLRKVDLPSGDISFVTDRRDDLCGGAINPACEPVVGLFRDHSAPGCVIAGTGLSHMGSSFGRVYRVCGSDITPAYSTPSPARPDRWMMAPRPWPLHALVETGDGWIGLSRDRYFVSRDGDVEERPMPEFRDWAGIRVSEEREGVLFLVAACCWGSSANPTLYHALALPVGP